MLVLVLLVVVAAVSIKTRANQGERGYSCEGAGWVQNRMNALTLTATGESLEECGVGRGADDVRLCSP